MLLLSIIIVSYNTRALTQQALESVIAETTTSKLLKNSTEFWVVDNNSADDTVKIVRNIQRACPSLHIIENTKNVGFAAANNQAIAQAKGKYILLLNSDTIVQPHAIEAMVQTFLLQPENQETAVLADTAQLIDHLGILSPQLYNPDGTPQAQGGSFPTLLTVAAQMLFLDDLPVIGRFFPSTQHTGKSQHQQSHQQLYALDWVGGTAMMVKKELFAEVGSLDSNIFMYGEDVEFCMRAKSHHWDIAVLPKAKITHFGSASSSSKNAVIGELKGYLYIWSKHKPLWQSPFILLLLQLGVHLRIFIFGTIVRNGAKAAIYRQAAVALKN